MQKQYRVGGKNLIPRPGDADFLNFVLTVAKPRRVHNVQRHAFNLDGLLHFVARGAGHGRHDGQLGTSQRVEQ